MATKKISDLDVWTFDDMTGDETFEVAVSGASKQIDVDELTKYFMYAHIMGDVSRDESTAITTSTKWVGRCWFPGLNVYLIACSLSTAQATGSVLKVDFKRNGSSVLSTQLSFDNTEKTTATSSAPFAFTSPPLILDQDDELEFHVTQVGDGTAKGLKFYIVGNPT